MMYIKNTFAEKKVALVVRFVTETRLAKTCFRGKTRNLSGNFSLWENTAEVFRNKLITDAVLMDVVKSDAGISSGNRVCIDFKSPVGWSGTDKLKTYRPCDLEWFGPNRRSTAMRVRMDRLDLRAPRTNHLTIVYELKPEGDALVAVIHTLYPGKDIGILAGNITARESCVFFDWNHPGE